ncbi:integral membrane protein [Xylariaceae sp. FL0016]|nr:integral membrane protein [Xylariaceae sp. FL0016]
MSKTTAPVGAVPPPPGVTPDFKNPQGEDWRAHLAILVVCTTLATLFFAVRCFAKFPTRRLLLEDWFCIAAWVSTMIYVSTNFTMIYYGVGLHAWEVTQENYQQILKWLYASSICYCPTAYLTKVTLLLLTARVFAIKPKVSQGITAFIWVLTLVYIPIQTLKVCICAPIRAYWDTSIQGAHCLAQRKIFVSDISVAIFTDLVILLLPIPLTWSMHLPLWKKCKIILLLGAGGAAVAVTVFRLIKQIEFLDSTDFTHDFAIMGLLTTVEVTIGLICACLPSASVLVERYWARYRRCHVITHNARCAKRMENKPRHWWEKHSWSSWATWATKITALTGTTAQVSTTHLKSCHTPCSEHELTLQRSFDVEQQMLSGKAIELSPLPESSQQSNQKNARKQLTFTSGDGFREGWLTTDVAANPELEGTADVEGIRRTVEISLRTVDLGGNELRPPDKIWDGT